MREYPYIDLSKLPIFAIGLLLAGCHAEWVREYPLQCRLDEQVALRDALHFGGRLPNGSTVTDDEWLRFRNQVIGVEFPAGYTELLASGHWRGKDGRELDEPSRIVLINHAATAANEAAMGRIVAAYRERFAQESVLRERSLVCLKF